MGVNCAFPAAGFGELPGNCWVCRFGVGASLPLPTLTAASKQSKLPAARQYRTMTPASLPAACQHRTMTSAALEANRRNAKKAGRPKGGMNADKLELSARCRVNDERHIKILERIAQFSPNEGYQLTAIRDL